MLPTESLYLCYEISLFVTQRVILSFKPRHLNILYFLYKYHAFFFSNYKNNNPKFLRLLSKLFRLTDISTGLHFPRALPTIKKEMHFSSLTDNITTYDTCPKCYTLYLYSNSVGLTKPYPPDYCEYIEPLSKRKCCSTIYQNDSNTPIKRTVYHCLISSLHKLYLRKRFEEK